MSLLDDARELLNRGPGDPGYPMDRPCPYCCFIPHQEECVWLSMPKIVKVLEAVHNQSTERVIWSAYWDESP